MQDREETPRALIPVNSKQDVGGVRNARNHTDTRDYGEQLPHKVLALEPSTQTIRATPQTPLRQYTNTYLE